MKIIYSWLWLMLLSTSAIFGQSYSIGGALIYGDDIQEFGGHMRAYYNSKNDKVCFGPEFSRFAKTKAMINGEEITKQLSEINFNLHYIFEIEEKWGLYPLIGLNWSSEKEEFELTNGASNSRTKNVIGANLGIGLHRPIDRWVLFVEFDHLFSDLSQNSFLIGAFFTFGKKEENE